MIIKEFKNAKKKNSKLLYQRNDTLDFSKIEFNNVILIIPLMDENFEKYKFHHK